MFKEHFGAYLARMSIAHAKWQPIDYIFKPRIFFRHRYNRNSGEASPKLLGDPKLGGKCLILGE